MVLLKRCASGEASTSRPKAGLALPGGARRSGSSASEVAACGSGNQLTASKPVLTPQKGSASEEANSLASSLTFWAKGVAAYCAATPQTLMPTWGTENCSWISRAIWAGSANESAVRNRLRAHCNSLSESSRFSLPLRIMSMTRNSSALIFSRNICAWRSCREIVRLLCGLLSCTAASNSAWRSKKSGVLAR